MLEKSYKKMAEYFKALSHPTRIKIIELVAEKERCVCEMMEILNLDQSHISRHLTILRSMEIVEDRREGNRVFYNLKDRESLDLIQTVKKKFFD
ncbi:ArsR family transcriptional regulator [Caldicellulosiruptor bescii]|uniref:Transcriptional regulator, ArsR family n=2 Tax=Caldicellulosiruptor bescii TaxID=31899 RepID=B9ML15_CALBD|nr:metalloregulator ArsR/SmtB family transcription factor [Caldicellulosiruptor bescii]ACM61023.1 transcriptional regulator, ArsR family [Caldicellulosiruptor bescii DSM 6725]PBC89163.1 ArsR family transcriptional regulator [Caldicellulosiruptor bescii]PBC91355.1 ArsR family transcriptional regulator [Caldicellulosiruptor bescii]PBD03233.1 ArsR family transcriptional regulator [Caldicellulosiruptor bescii]PBD07153.1 ArsR family transcriptional regulator [Caldicellulosiruptor bescii]